MKVLFIITGLGLGGAEIVTMNIAENMARKGHSVYVMYLTGENSFFKERSTFIDFIPLSMTKNIISFVKSLLKARRRLKQISPDVVHSQMFHSNVFARLLRLFVNIPFLICSEHNVNIEGEMRMIVYRVTNFLSDLNTNVSKESLDYFVKTKTFSSGNSIPMYNGIDLSKCVFNKDQKIRQEFGCLQNDFLLLNVGRLTIAKGQKKLVEAIAQVDNCKLIICGQGECENEIRETINKFNLNNRVFLAGARTNMADFYSAVDCFVLSSLWEGLPMVILEAMAFKLPIISTNVGGVCETINDYNWIVPTNNVEEMASIISKMKEMPLVERTRIGYENYLKVKKFDLDNICDSWINIYVNRG